MKISYKRSVIAIAALLTLLAFAGVASAPPAVGIGSDVQTVPFECNPNARVAGGRFVPGDTAVWDTSVATSFKLDWSATGYWGVTDFDRPSDVEKDEFDIGWIDIKIKYYCTGSVDDILGIEYRVPPDTTWLKLQPDVSGTDAINPVGANTLANAWHNPVEPNDGVWTWPEVESLEVRLVTTVVGMAEMPFLYWTDVYEIWVSAYPPPLPPSDSTACSIQPVMGGPIGLYQYYYVDVFVTDVEQLAGWEFVLNFDPAVLYPVEGWVYAPWTDVGWITLDAGLGLANIATSIHIDHPLIDTGWNGSGPLGRVYFATMADPAFTWLTLSKMKISPPTGDTFLHTDHHGCYGTPPTGEHLLSLQYTGVEFNWSDPVCTYWTEDVNETGTVWHLASWEDNGDERFTPSDQIDMLPEPPDGYKYWYHVDVTGVVTPSGNVYMIVTYKTKEETPEFPLGLGLLMVIALAIPIVYLWRTRKNLWRTRKKET